MKKLALLALCLFVAGLAAAQMPSGPAPELARYDAMLGNWEGSGGGHGPDGKPMKWTSKATTKKILGGHFIQNDMQVTVEGMGAITMRDIYGWDADQKRHFVLNCSNMHTPAENTVWWAGENKMITSHTMREDGHVSSERWTTHLEKDKMTFVGMTSIDGANAFVHVDGSATRGGEGFSPTAEDSAMAIMPPHENMAKMKPFTGSWTIDAKFKMMPGSDWTKMTGTQQIGSNYGGHAIIGKSTMEAGGMGSWQEMSIGFWSDDHQCFRWYGLNSMGMVVRMNGYVLGEGKSAWMRLGTFMGQPTMGRLNLQVTGDTMTAVEHSMGSSGDALVTFEGTFTRAKS